MNFWEWLDKNGEGVCVFVIVMTLIFSITFNQIGE